MKVLSPGIFGCDKYWYDAAAAVLTSEMAGSGEAMLSIKAAAAA